MPPPFLSHQVVSKHIFLRKYQEHYYSIKQFLGFTSTLERVAHPWIVERNLTPTYMMTDWSNKSK